MIGSPPPTPFEQFCQRLLSLFEGGRFSATYKYAVLLGLLDLLTENVGRDGAAPEAVGTRDLARKVISLYWPHTRPFKPTAMVLLQNKGVQARIVADIDSFRAVTIGDPTVSLTAARAAAPDAFERLVRQVEFKLIEMPLGRLQTVGDAHDPFIYEISWPRDKPPTEAQVHANNFTGTLTLHPGVAAYLMRANPLVRPLIQREWALTVSACNDELLGDDLDEFLFGAGRVSLLPLRTGLREATEGMCMYCDSGVPENGAEIDHFVPWRRHIDNGLANLVYAHRACNNAKRDHLAAEVHVQHWVIRLNDSAYHAKLSQVAADKSWEYDPSTTVAAARGVYLSLYAGFPLWHHQKVFAPADVTRLADILR